MKLQGVEMPLCATYNCDCRIWGVCRWQASKEGLAYIPRSSRWVLASPSAFLETPALPMSSIPAPRRNRTVKSILVGFERK